MKHLKKCLDDIITLPLATGQRSDMVSSLGNASSMGIILAIDGKTFMAEVRLDFSAFNFLFFCLNVVN